MPRKNLNSSHQFENGSLLSGDQGTTKENNGNIPSSKPFLQTLLSSSPFASMFGSFESLNDKEELGRAEESVSNDHRKSNSSFLSFGLKNLYGWSESFYGDPSVQSSQSSVEQIGDTLSAEDRMSQLSLQKPSLSEDLPSHLSLEIVNDLVDNFNEENEQSKQTLIDSIKHCFSSNEILSKSFVLDASKKEAHPSGLDIKSVRTSYLKLLSLPAKQKEQIVLVLVNAIEIIQAKIHMNLARLYHAPDKNLRPLLILLENPLLNDRPHHDGLLKKLMMILGHLHGPAKQTIMIWFSKYDSLGFQRIVDLANHLLADQHLAKDDEGILATLKFLSLLSKANQKQKISLELIPIHSFYNESLIKKLNFKEEYKTWKKVTAKQSPSDQNSLRKQPSSTLSAPTFSYFQYPFLFDPVAKTRIMHIDAIVQMSQGYEDAFVNQALVVHAQRLLSESSPAISDLEKQTKQATNPYLVVEVKRENLLEDTMDQLRRKKTELKKAFKVKFVNEEGMDQGGVQKEFFQILINQLLDPAYGMFVYDEETRYSWINGASLESLHHFELVGLILGLALYNGVMLDVNFPLLLYKKLLGERVGLKDLSLAFPSLGRGLQQLLDWEEGDVGDVFMRTFEISYDVYGKVLTFPLIENGADIMVTNENRKTFVDLYIKHLTQESVKKQFQAFQKGFLKVVGGQALHLCRAEELELLICGTATTELDFTELEEGCGYDDGYHPEHPIIQWFWSIVHQDMSFEQRKMLLNFVTASDRVPLRGLGKLTFVIQRNGPDTDRLPTALTCFGRLLLPEYASKDKLRNRLITAIENAKGFGLV